MSVEEFFRLLPTLILIGFIIAMITVFVYEGKESE